MSFLGLNETQIFDLVLGNHGQYMVAGQRATYEEGRNSNGADVVFLIERKSTCPADFHTHQVWTLMQSFLLALVKTYSMEVKSFTLSQKDKVQFIREYSASQVSLEEGFFTG